MVSASLKQNIVCRLREFRREPSAMYWVISMPLFWMVVLGLAFSDPKPPQYTIGLSGSGDLGLGELNLDYDALAQGLNRHDQLKVIVGTAADAETWFRRGQIVLAMQLEEGQLKFQRDPANPDSIAAQRVVHEALNGLSGYRRPYEAIVEDRSMVGGRYIDFLIPGLLALSIMTTSLFGVGMTMVSNRRENLLKRYLVTPMPPQDYLISHGISRLGILALEIAIVLSAGWLIFGFNLQGSFVSFLVTCVLGCAAFTALSILCAARTRSIPVISGITNLLTILMVMLCGVFYSVSNFPDWLQSVVKYLPLSLLVDGMRKIALEAAGPDQLLLEWGGLALLTLVFGFMGLRRFRFY